MNLSWKHFCQFILARDVLCIYTVVLSVWIPVFLNWIPNGLSSILVPLWIPGYIALINAIIIQNAAFGSTTASVSLYVLMGGFLFLESVLLASVYRLAKHIYISYREPLKERLSAS